MFSEYNEEWAQSNDLKINKKISAVMEFHNGTNRISNLGTGKAYEDTQ